MPKKKSLKEFFRGGKEKGLENCIKGINSSKVYKKPTNKVLRDYYRMINL